MSGNPLLLGYTPQYLSYRIAEFSRTKLKIPEGFNALSDKRDDDGRPIHNPLILQGFQRTFFRNAFAVQEAAQSIGRKNGKTSGIAVLCLFYLFSEDVKKNPIPFFTAIAGSLTGDLTGALCKAIMNIATVSGIAPTKKHLRYNSTPAPGRIVSEINHNGTLAEIDFIANGRAGGNSKNAHLALFDETGLTEERDRAFLSSLRESLAAKEGKMLHFSIRGDSEIYTEIKEKADDEYTYWQEFAPPMDADWSDEEVWKLGNPGLGTIKSWASMRKSYMDAKDNEKQEQIFKSKDLNMPINPERSMVCTKQAWSACETEDPPLPVGNAYVGIDLGGTSSLTAGAIYWPTTGLLRVYAALPDKPPLGKRGKQDKVGDLYTRMLEAGELTVHECEVTPVDGFIKVLVGHLQNVRVEKVYADRHRFDELVGALRSNNIYWNPEKFSGGAAQTALIIAFQKAIRVGRIRSKPSLLMRQAVESSKIEHLSDDKCKLVRAAFGGRIDALSAATLAVGKGFQDKGENPITVTERLRPGRVKRR